MHVYCPISLASCDLSWEILNDYTYGQVSSQHINEIEFSTIDENHSAEQDLGRSP